MHYYEHGLISDKELKRFLRERETLSQGDIWDDERERRQELEDSVRPDKN